MSQSKESNILFLKSGCVGLLTGLIAALFHQLLESVEKWHMLLCQNIDGSLLLLLLTCVLTSTAVILSIFLVRTFAPEASGSGIPEIENTLTTHKKIRWQRVIPVKFFGGLLSIGSGMLLGREGPTIHMGGALGAMLGDGKKQNRFQRHVLVAAGAAAGLTAAFNAPLAGLIFVIEEMRGQFKYTVQSILAVTLSCTVALITVQLLGGQQSAIANAVFHAPSLSVLPLFAFLGVCFGVIGTQYNKLLLVSVAFGKRLNGMKVYLFGAAVALLVAVISFFFPLASGGGHDALEHALGNSFTISSLLIIFAVRFLLSIFSYAVGTPGGIFAPLLALGTFFGLWYGKVMMSIFPGLIEYPGIFVVAGMGALFAATVQAPLTGIILIIEMTRSYELILPLMVTCLAASLTANRLGGKPIYSQLE